MRIKAINSRVLAGYQSKNSYIEFTSNGTIIIDDGEMIFTGTYEVISENYIKTNNPMLGLLFEIGGDTLKFQISGDTLKLGGDNSKTLKRVR
jgi:hypothetical protein